MTIDEFIEKLEKVKRVSPSRVRLFIDMSSFEGAELPLSDVEVYPSNKDGGGLRLVLMVGNPL